MNLIQSFKLRKLQRERMRTCAFYDKKLKSADYSKQGEIENDAYNEYRMQDEEIASFITHCLVSKAEHMFIPIPPRNDKTYWEGAYTNEDYKVLSDAGVAHIRDLIREEKKKRREAANFWIELVIKLLTLLIGLSGAAIGIISVWRKP